MAGRDGEISIEAGIDATRGMHLSKPLPYPGWSDQAPGGISLLDLPLQEIKGDVGSLKHIVDIITNVPPPDKSAIELVINSGHWGRDRLPEPFCLKCDMEVKLITQFVVIRQENGNVSILKHMYSPDLKLTRAAAVSFCFGTPHTLKWQGHAQNFRKGFQWFLEQLGGWQCRQYTLTHLLPCHQARADGSKAGGYMATLSEEDVNKGFAFIEEESGRLGTEWKRVQWMTKNLNIDQESPIYSWPPGLVEKALRALQSDGVLALPVEDFHFTLADVDYSVLDFAVRHMLKQLKTHATGFIGGPGSGKTPLARILAMSISRYWKRALHISSPASFREASEFDFFRGQAGRKDRPDIHDDGCLASEPIRKMKGFADVGCTMLTKERWGAAKFVQGQMRIFVCNDFEFTPWLHEHQGITGGTTLHMQHEDFLKVIAPMFPERTEPPHIMAVLKRANLLVNAGKIMIFRPATQEEISVQCLVKSSTVEFLNPNAGKRYQAYRDNEKTKPSTFEADLQWEADYVDAILAGNPPPGPRVSVDNSAMRRLFWGSSPPPQALPRSPHPAPATRNSSTASSPMPKAAPIKEEPRPFRRALSSVLTGVIDLDSPPTKKAATEPAVLEMKSEVSVDIEPESAGTARPVEPSDGAVHGIPPLADGIEHANDCPKAPLWMWLPNVVPFMTPWPISHKSSMAFPKSWPTSLTRKRQTTAASEHLSL